MLLSVRGVLKLTWYSLLLVSYFIYFCDNVVILSHYIFFFRFIYETEHHNGIAELLEILGR